MQILVREGSVSKDLHALAPIITERHSPFIAFCTDDRNPLDIAEEGHLDFIIRTAISLGAPPLAAYRAASISAARIFGLMDRGLVAPGWRADLVVVDDLDELRGLDGDDRRAGSSARNCSPRAGRSRRSAATASRRGASRAADFAARGQGAVDAGDRRRARQDHHRARARRPCPSPTACAGSISTRISSRSRSSRATASTTISRSPSSTASA